MQDSDQPKQPPRRLTAVLNDPSAEWPEIISAVEARARAQGGGAVKNHALSSTRKLDDHAAEQSMNNKATDSDSSDDEEQAAKTGSSDDKLMPLGNINRRASLASQSSIERHSRRSLFRREALRRQSLRRNATLESVGKSGSASSRSTPRPESSRSSFSGKSITISPAFNCSTSSINSVNIMDFGVSHRALAASLDPNRQSFSSLDDDVLDELEGELYGDGNEEGMGGSRRGLLVSWRSKNDSSLRSIHNGGSNEQPTRSEGDLDDYQDTCGFMDWPSVADGSNDTIQEENEPIKTEEEWNIEDYEQNIDDAVRSGQRRSGQRRSGRNFLSQSLTKSLRVFERSPSLESSFASQEGITDLIKQKLLSTKNNHQQQENNDRKKHNHFSFTSALRRSSSDADERTKSGEAIWVREESGDPGVGEQYRNIYAAAAAESPKTQKKSLFSYF